MSTTEVDGSIGEPLKRANADTLEKYAIDVNRDLYSIPLNQMNPAHPDLFQANVAPEYFARLRAEDPVHLCEEGQFAPYWSITKYEDIEYVDTHHDLFSSDILNGGIRIGGRPIEGEPNPMSHLPMFIMQDPPKHDEQREVLASKFRPNNMNELEPLIRERAGHILDKLPRGEPFNWVREVSVELTGQMLATLFDIPQEDRHLLIHWSDTIERLGDPNYFETIEDGFKELWKCHEYFDAVWKKRAAQSERGFDLISMLVHGEATKNMTPNEYLGNIILLIVGGNDTTRNSITGGVLALNQFPEQYDKLMANPELIPSMVNEVIRWQSPIAHMCRTAMEDTEIRGKQIKKGDKIVMWYTSGNRDDEIIPNANEFMIDRPKFPRHLSFGKGLHHCLGKRLGEMQLKTIWEEIIKRFSRIEVVGEPTYLRSSFINGITDLPVIVHDR
ncbi:MAG: cytochrome P450 [Alphaproteobacteria bacterium]|nr:MAG: cytochrome P450 [Alphaproteobacteria bacterium]